MKRLMSLLVISLISTNVGCTLCSDCDDYSYGAFGGHWERTDMTNGRVGTAFSTDDPNVYGGDSDFSENLESAAPEFLEELEKPPVDNESPLDDAPPLNNDQPLSDADNGPLLDT
jgi:hypothetical protein